MDTKTNDLLNLLRDERDAWMQARRDLYSQVEYMRERGLTKMADSLRVAFEYAAAQERNADDVLKAAEAIVKA